MAGFMLGSLPGRHPHIVLGSLPLFSGACVSGCSFFFSISFPCVSENYDSVTWQLCVVAAWFRQCYEMVMVPFVWDYPSFYVVIEVCGYIFNILLQILFHVFVSCSAGSWGTVLRENDGLSTSSSLWDLQRCLTGFAIFVVSFLNVSCETCGVSLSLSASEFYSWPVSSSMGPL